MALELAEDYIRIAGAAGGYLTAAGVVADCWINGIPTAAAHLAVALVAMLTVSGALRYSMRPLRRRPAPAPAPEPVPAAAAPASAADPAPED